MNKKITKLLITVLITSFAQAHAGEVRINLQNAQNSPNFINNINSSRNNYDLIKLITLDGMTSSESITEISNGNFISYFISGDDKFAQANIPAAYKDYAQALLLSNNNDFQCLLIAYKLANIGFFTLSQQAVNQISDIKLYEQQINAIKNIFYPSSALAYDEEVQLAELYTDIYYNNLTKESAKELAKRTNLIKKSDYANYIMGQAYFEAGEFNKALSYINKALAIKKNSPSYLLYKAKILCETKDYKAALKILNNLSNSPNMVEQFNKSVTAQKEFTLARFYKNDSNSKYHIAKYFEILGENNRALKEANNSITLNKKNYAAHTLIGDILADRGEFSKAKEAYNKALTYNKKYAPALKGLGAVEMVSGTYEDALNYYTQAQKYNKNDIDVLTATIKLLGLTGNSVKAKELCAYALLKHPNSSDLYYTMSEMYPEKQTEYLKKAISLNAFNNDAWINLAESSIMKNDLKQAEKDLLPVKITEKENYRYYYVEGLLNKAKGSNTKAVTNFKKALKLNPNYTPAQKELNTLNL